MLVIKVAAGGGFETYRTVRSQITNEAVRMVRNTGKNTRLLWVELSGDCERSSTVFHRPESGGSFIVVADVVSLGLRGGIRRVCKGSVGSLKLWCEAPF